MVSPSARRVRKFVEAWVAEHEEWGFCKGNGDNCLDIRDLIKMVAECEGPHPWAAVTNEGTGGGGAPILWVRKTFACRDDTRKFIASSKIKDLKVARWDEEGLVGCWRLAKRE